MSLPVTLTIAGSDSGGGAGIQADLKTFGALGTYGASVVTALTAQNTQGVTGIHDVPAEFVTRQMDAVYSDIAVAATKIGMVSRTDIITAIADGLTRWQVRNIVLDPVMVATSGDALLKVDAITMLRDVLLPHADVLTPNLPEAAMLTGTDIAETEARMIEQAQALLALGPKAVLVKGGHGHGDYSVDLLVSAAGIERLAVPRVATANTHGTGCTLSAAIAAGLAKGSPLTLAVAEAKTYVTRAIEAGAALNIGNGHGPLNHFYDEATRRSPRKGR